MGKLRHAAPLPSPPHGVSVFWGCKCIGVSGLLESRVIGWRGDHRATVGVPGYWGAQSLGSEAVGVPSSWGAKLLGARLLWCTTY